MKLSKAILMAAAFVVVVYFIIVGVVIPAAQGLSKLLGLGF